MPSHRKTGVSYHRYGIETVHEIGWRGSMNSVVAKAGKADRKECIQERLILQARKQETGDVTAGNPGQEGNDDFDVESYLYREAVLRSAPRKWTVKPKAVSHQERLERVRVEWSRQLDTLTDTYVKWKQALEQIDPLQEEVVNGWEATTFSMSHYRQNQSFPTIDEDPFVNVTLIKRGFLGPVPTYPTTLFSLENLEDCRLERLQTKRWSFAQKANTLCQKHNVTYRASLGGHFRDAFNVYPSVLDNIKPGPSS